MGYLAGRLLLRRVLMHAVLPLLLAGTNQPAGLHTSDVGARAPQHPSREVGGRRVVVGPGGEAVSSAEYSQPVGRGGWWEGEGLETATHSLAVVAPAADAPFPQLARWPSAQRRDGILVLARRVSLRLEEHGRLSDLGPGYLGGKSTHVSLPYSIQHARTPHVCLSSVCRPAINQDRSAPPLRSRPDILVAYPIQTPHLAKR